MTVDFLIAGAGPAGARAAEGFARQGASVLLLDPRAPWEKPCGGGLTAAALRLTPELGELRTVGMRVGELSLIAPGGASVAVPLRRPWLVVNRLDLGRWGLDRATRAGARFQSAGVDRLEHHRFGWTVRDTLGESHRARWLVGADGAASRMRHLLAPGFQPARFAALVTYLGTGAPPGQAVLRFLPTRDGYAWVFPRIDRHSIGVAVRSGTLRRRDLERVIRDFPGTSGVVSTESVHGATLATWDWEAGGFRNLGGADFALLGDAAGLADPVSGEGISYALRSADLAVRSFDPARGFTRYPDAVRRAWRPDRQRARLVRRWIYRPPVIERLVRRAPKHESARRVLSIVANAMNEHRALLAATRRTGR